MEGGRRRAREGATGRAAHQPEAVTPDRADLLAPGDQRVGINGNLLLRSHLNEGIALPDADFEIGPRARAIHPLLGHLGSGHDLGRESDRAECYVHGSASANGLRGVDHPDLAASEPLLDRVVAQVHAPRPPEVGAALSAEVQQNPALHQNGHGPWPMTILVKSPESNRGSSPLEPKSHLATH
jgi:hypothetical protein